MTALAIVFLAHLLVAWAMGIVHWACGTDVLFDGDERGVT